MEALKSVRPRYLGIMVCAGESSGTDRPQRPDNRFLAKLCAIGERQGLRVFVFSPCWLSEDRRSVSGYRYQAADGTWTYETFPLPDLIYDRVFYRSPDGYRQHKAALREMLFHKKIPFLGRSLNGKEEVYEALKRYDAFRPYLPLTLPYRGPAQLLRWLRRHGEAVLKPAAGTHGKGVLHILRAAGGEYRIRGRSRSNRMFAAAFDSPFPLLRLLDRIAAQRAYLLQPYLPLTTQAGDTFDVRALAQKDGRGRWTVTGLAVRKGAAGSLTSNLHGGGSAEAIAPFLESEYGREAAVRLERELLELARTIPPALERCFGRLAELGIDLGIGRDGRIWIIEVNSKPGRSAFESGKAGKNAGELSLLRPVAYAGFLLRQPCGPDVLK
jgi:glutathione synthase/RimK-type ligase-like ATP-grasp enzyme